VQGGDGVPFSTQPVLERLGRLRDRAASGHAVVLQVEGEAGFGKSALLADLTELCSGFRILAATAGETTMPAPYRMLEQWLGTTVPALTAPALAAQHLRDTLDDRPTLLMADDLHWADAESVVALTEVVSRVDGDPLLVAVTTRPLSPHGHPDWQRWCRQAEASGRLERLLVAGLALDEATALLRRRHPELSLRVVQALWEHTAGNPLHLLALAAEYAPEDLERTQSLPAPRSLAASVTAVLDRLPDDAVTTARALAVLGDRWQPLPLVAEVTGLSDVAAAAQHLANAGLLEIRPETPQSTVRLGHALVRAAVYQAIELPERRELHRRAAQVVGGRRRVLDHRIAATQHFDPDLAADLEALARQLHDQRSHRLAAHYLAAASLLSPDAPDRERRLLDSLFEALVAGDRRAVRDEIEAVTDALDTARRGLVLGTLALWERRYREGLAELEAVKELDDVDALTGYRIDVLLAWGQLMTGAPPAGIREALDRAARRGVVDGSVRHFAVLADGQLATRSADVDEVLAQAAALGPDPQTIPVDATALLRWRGALYLGVGHFAAAAADLTELVARMQRGQAELSSGAYHALLATAHWFEGRWDLARLNARLALDLTGEYLHPVVAATTPAVPSGDGDLPTADDMLRRARELLDPAPWVESVDMLAVSHVIREHAAGTPTPATFAVFRAGLDDIRAGRTQKNVVWCLHAGLAAVWAREFDDVTLCLDRLAAAHDRTAWTRPAVHWLRGLAGEARGNGKQALLALRRAVASAPVEMPLYGAHMQQDLARLAHLMNDAATARHAQEQALATYRRLGARAYVTRMEALLAAVPAQRSQPTLGLTERERDVLTLVASGMSYAQISSTLFITQSTVGFHLGRIYAKANVNSRHQLTQLVRSDPSAFGLA
jgi:DNA-binding CsgD family transcriptional regulator